MTSRTTHSITELAASLNAQEQQERDEALDSCKMAEPIGCDSCETCTSHHEAHCNECTLPLDEQIITLEEQYGCDPWDDEHYGIHPASREPDPERVVRGCGW